MSDLPEKPAPPELPDDGVDAPTDQEEEEAAGTVRLLEPDEADADDTVDNTEQQEHPHDDLPDED